MTDPRDELARLQAEADQGMAQTASMLWSLFSELRDEGFNEGQALSLTAAWIKAVLSTAPGEQ